MAERRYDKYPSISRDVRLMSETDRAAVAKWHRVLTTALEGYLPHAKEEAISVFTEGDGQWAAGEGARVAVQAWLTTMREVAAIIVDPSVADWCCKPGMEAYPERCPQHGFDPKVQYELGTIIQRPYGEGRERAVMVRDDSEAPHPWVSVEFPTRYNWVDLKVGVWSVVGRV